MPIGMKLGILSELDAVTVSAGYSGGAGEILLTPSGVGTYTQWPSQQNSGGSAVHWEILSQTSGSASTPSRYVLSPSSYSPGWYTSAIVIYENSTLTQGSTLLPTSNYNSDPGHLLTEDFTAADPTKRPSDGAAWTINDIENLEIGIKGVASGHIDTFEVAQSNKATGGNSHSAVPVGATIDKVTVSGRGNVGYITYKGIKSATFWLTLWGVVEYS